MDNNLPIDSLKISEKLRALRNFELPELQAQLAEEPRYLEMLWFLQWVSVPENHPGGLEKFCDEFIVAHAARIGSKYFPAAGNVENLTSSQVEKLVEDLDIPSISHLHDDRESLPSLFPSLEHQKNQEEERKRIEWEIENGKPWGKAWECIPAASVREEILDLAYREVASYFRALCEKNTCFFETVAIRRVYVDGLDFSTHTQNPPLYWPSICQDLLSWMDCRADETQKEIAATRVSSEILKWIRRSRECNQPVWLTGSCRYGKTATIQCLAKAFPGRYRVVRTPDDQSVLSLCSTVAATLGIETLNETVLTLRAKIEEVVHQSGLMMIFDESHFLFPVTVTRTTRPRRLDFVRTTIIDRGHPAAFISTPQSYHEARRKLEKMTGYTQGQWDGRMLREDPVKLPEEISFDEKIAVAAIHFTGFDSKIQLYVAKMVSAVRGSSEFAQIQKVAVMSRTIARENGRTQPKFDDIKEAVDQVLPVLAPEPPTKQVQVTLPSAPRKAKRISHEEEGEPFSSHRPETISTNLQIPAPAMRTPVLEHFS